MRVDRDQLEALSLGAVFLATGGGGDPYLARVIADRVLREHGPVRLLPVDALDDNAKVVTIGDVGAPTVSLELLPSVDDAARALAAWEAHTGTHVDALASFEIGGGNSLIPIIAAAGRGIPVIDGDGMGRALPEAQMMSYPIAGVSPSPAIALDYAGNVTTFTTPDTRDYERHVRAVAMASGGMITTVEHPMRGDVLKRAIIPGTVSFAMRLGELLLEHRGGAAALQASLQALFADSIYGECRLLFRGKVADKRTRVVGGYDVGEALVAGFGDSAETLEISIKNEYLLATRGGTVLASVPDLIVIVDDETARPINAERLRYGQRVAVFAIGCPAFYRQPAALREVEPRRFGFDIGYVPLEELGV